jgi:Undecaprenyl-phosphate galactose phosphotransferase WbaP
VSTTTALPLAGGETQTRSAFSTSLTISTIIAADVLSFLAAGIVSVLVRHAFGGQFLLSDYLGFAPCIVLLFFVFAFNHLYPGVATNPIDEFRCVLRSASIGFLVIIGSTVFFREAVLSSRLVYVFSWLLTILLVPVARHTVRKLCCRLPLWGIPTVIIGRRAAAEALLNGFRRNPHLGLRPVAVLEDETESDIAECVTPTPILRGRLTTAHEISLLYRDAYAVLAVQGAEVFQLSSIVSECAACYKKVLIVPEMSALNSLSIRARDLSGSLILEVDHYLIRRVPQLIKRGFDILCCGSLLLPLLPLLAITYLMVRYTSSGPAIYAHRRLGRHGKAFSVYKFRTMVMNAEAVLQEHLEQNPELRQEWERDHKLRRDPRVTSVGRWLRKTSLDELPQLWNVLRGEMTLVGPRPIVEHEVLKYGESYRQYCRVIPGITGLWQISGRNNTSYGDRVRLDEYYVRNWSVSLDLYVLFRTLKTVLRGEGAY